MLAALIATLLLTSAEVGCTRDGLREEMRMCAESWQLVLLSGVAHFLAVVSVNLALFHGTVTLVSIIKAADPVRPISSGFSAGRGSEWHQEHCPAGTGPYPSGSACSGGYWALDSEEQVCALMR